MAQQPEIVTRFRKRYEEAKANGEIFEADEVWLMNHAEASQVIVTLLWMRQNPELPGNLKMEMETLIVDLCQQWFEHDARYTTPV